MTTLSASARQWLASTAEPTCDMTGIELLRDLRRRGFTLRLTDDKILVSPAETIDPETARAIRENRTALLGCLELEGVVMPFTGRVFG